MSNQSSTQVLCAEHRRLLKESHAALAKWNKGRAEIHKSGRRGRDADRTPGTPSDLREAWALLQYHAQDREVRQVISIIERVRSEAEMDMLRELYN